MTSIGRHDASGAWRQMERLTLASARNAARLASGTRIATAADDPAGLASSARLLAVARSAEVGARNLADGQGLVQTAEAALQTSQEGLGRMRELAIAAQNGTLSAADREIIQQEYDQLAAQLDQTAGGTTLGGRALLDGSSRGANAVVVGDGAGGEHRIDVPDLRGAALGVAGRSVADPHTLAALDEASRQVAQTRATLGGHDVAMERHSRQLGAAGEAAAAARSRGQDADIGEVASATARDRILLQLALAGQRQHLASGRTRLDLLG